MKDDSQASSLTPQASSLGPQASRLGPDTPGLAIDVRELRKEFSGVAAVKDVDLQIKTGEIFGFLGPNGAGKSTTIRMLCGILVPTSGHGTVAGYDVLRESEKIKKVIGYMSQHFGLYQDLTVEENIDFYSSIYLGRSARDIRNQLIEDMGLIRYRKYLAGALSGGWKQRLALACAISHKPKVLFLDEPTAGIDPLSRRVLWDILYQMASEGVTLFVTTHYMDEAEHCHRLGFIMDGVIKAMASPQEIKNKKMKGEVVLLRCADNRKAFELLKDLPDFRDVNIYGDSLHLVTGNAKDSIPEIQQLLETSSVTIQELRQIEATIEDVFVALGKETPQV